jgi:TolB-like protein/tetratricopeptide (TPR) repeat protein
LVVEEDRMTELRESVFARDAFVSYANQDTAVADRLCQSLEDRGIRCWIAPRDVMPGALYADSIVRAINGSKMLVLVLSPSSVASPHVSKEIERASSKRRPIIALKLTDAELTPALEYFLSESQWVAVGTGGLDAALLKLGEGVERLLAGPGGIAGPGAARPAIPATALAAETAAAVSVVRPRKRWIALAVMLFAALATGIVAKRWIPARTAHSSVAAESASNHEASSAGAGRSVAVLPFEDLSENKDQAYFSDGLSTELIELLAKIPGLRVPARTSSFYFKGKQSTLQEIARALNVSHVLEGTVRKSGQTLRITTDLVRIDDGTPMWSQTYDRKLDDIFKIQDEIAGSVVSALKISLLGGAAPRATPTASPAAYTAFLKCAAAQRGENRAGMQHRFVSSAVEPYEVVRPKIYAAIQKAQSIDPGSAEGHVAMATLLYQMDFDPAAAHMELTKVLANDPGNASATWLSGYIADIQGRFADSLRFFELAKDTDPLDTDVYLQIGNAHYRAGQFPEAAAAYRAALAIEPRTGSVHYRLGLIALAQGDPNAALAEFEMEQDPDFHSVGLPLAYDALGRTADANKALASAEITAGLGAAYQIALIHAARHDRDRAFQWLDRAYRQRDAGMLWIKADPLLKGLMPDPRFNVLLQKMHLS